MDQGSNAPRARADILCAPKATQALEVLEVQMYYCCLLFSRSAFKSQANVNAHRQPNILTGGCRNAGWVGRMRSDLTCHSHCRLVPPREGWSITKEGHACLQFPTGDWVQRKTASCLLLMLCNCLPSGVFLQEPVAEASHCLWPQESFAPCRHTHRVLWKIPDIRHMHCKVPALFRPVVCDVHA